MRVPWNLGLTRANESLQCAAAELDSVHDVVSILPRNQIDLGAKVAFLSGVKACSPAVNEVIRRETHMSWVFLVGDNVYKLKKPVRFP
jgi:hypothetical protein